MRKELSGNETELLIQFWHEEPSLWDVAKGSYRNEDIKVAFMKNLMLNFTVGM